MKQRPITFHRTGNRYESTCPRCGGVLVASHKPETAICGRCGHTGPAIADDEGSTTQ